MEYTQLGRTGLSVSRICLGTMNFGHHTAPPEAHAIMDAAHDAGVNFFDTANVYGGQGHKGRTEQIVGSWFASGGGRRERTVLATKVYGDMSADAWPNSGRLSALNIRRALDASLQRLQTDYIDLYQFHHIDRTTPWEEIWQAVDVAIRQGKILYAGSSNFAGWHLAEAQATAAERGMVGLVSEQSLYNLLVRDIELEVIPAATHHGIGILPWSPLRSGLLAGILRSEDRGGRRAEVADRGDLDAVRPQIERYEALAGELGVEPAQLGIAWLLHQPAVTAPISGVRTRDQLDGLVASVDIELDADVLARLDEIFPGKKTAPEHYAW